MPVVARGCKFIEQLVVERWMHVEGIAHSVADGNEFPVAGLLCPLTTNASPFSSGESELFIDVRMRCRNKMLRRARSC